MTEEDERIARALRLLMDRQVTPVPVPMARLLHRGRSARRLRTLTGIATGAGGVAAVCVVALTLAPAATVQPPAPPAARSTTATPSVVATPAPTGAAELLELLRSKVPTGLKLSNPWTLDRTSDIPLTPGVSVKHAAAAYIASDGSGTGNIRIEVGRAAPSADGTVHPPACNIPGCTVTAQPDGGFLTLSLPARAAGGEQDWRATVQRPDGTTVTAGAGNIPGPGSDRKEPYPNPPLLTGVQLSALALDPAWHQAAAALPAP
ncbi:hypothetical protein KCMC57_up36580 [Kitasatospora sp. CMC57]|uniref:Uncharacterized protein n=1 Tax=Kitasatospora sp. CMC57 TaxID=3231513 RepID=A0AB33JXA4_9ACTN